MTPLRSMENSTEASTWAFSNQEKQGHRGNFTPKPKRNMRLARLAARGADRIASRVKTPSRK